MEHNIHEIFGSNLRRLRLERKLTQEQCAALIDISTKHLSNMEVGNRFPSAETIEKICTALDIAPAFLFYTADVCISPADRQAYFEHIIDEHMGKAANRLKDGLRGNIVPPSTHHKN